MTALTQTALFAIEPTLAAPVSGVPAGQFDAAAYDTALTADGYGWLADLLPTPQSPLCEGCGRPMMLPAAPVLWACPACYPGVESP